MRKTPLALLCGILLTGLGAEAYAQGFSLVLLGGLSKDSRTQTESVWKAGLNLAGHAFVSVPGITIGGRVAFHSWGADGEGWLKEVTKSGSTSYTLNSADGSQTVIEIVPAIRLALLNPPVGLRIDLQIGAGLFLVSSSEVTVTGSFNTGTSSGQTTWVLATESLTGFGPQAALPLTLGGMIEIVPVYSAYNAGGDWYNHFAINAGFRFGI
ncbi:MAG: hypothetical protein HYW57_05100 [Ignavibacteriales bacterium]|nr:hypothetical protein [Ignavibacteriales bacterium]